jgi:hypothetical protein
MTSESLIILLALLAGVGWVQAALAYGMWRGERGRRKDLQWLVGVMQPDGQGATPGPEIERVRTEDEEAVIHAETEAIAETIFEEARAADQEISAEEAHAEARRMVLELYGGSRG